MGLLVFKVALPGGVLRRLRIDANESPALTLGRLFELLGYSSSGSLAESASGGFGAANHGAPIQRHRLRWEDGSSAGVVLDDDTALAQAVSLAVASRGTGTSATTLNLVLDEDLAAKTTAAQREGRAPPPLIGQIAGDHHRKFYQQLHKVPFGHRHRPFTGPVPAVVVDDTDNRFRAEAPAPIVDQPTLCVPPELQERFKEDSVRFSVNGVPCTLDSSVNPRTVLVDYLRDTLKLFGTKIGCGEGGCGACTVTLIRPSPRGKETVSANACLVPICSLDGVAVITVEGIGSESKGYHKLQEDLAGCDGSQCGYCSPGMIMNMYSLLSAGNSANSRAPDISTVEGRLQGNICRCTGYRSIYSAFRKSVEQHRTPSAASTTTAEAPVVSISPSVLGQTAADSPDKSLWFNPASLADVWPLLDKYGTNRVQLTVGGTSAGIVKYYSGFGSKATQPQVYINLRRVPEINGISSGESSGVTFGASVSLSTMIDTLATLSTEHANLKPLVDHLHLVAHWQVRDQASWAGNVMVCKKFPAFPSDVCTMMAAAGATVQVGSKAGIAPSVPLARFLKSPADPLTILVSLFVPFNDGKVLDTFKVMSRHANAHAYVNAGMLATMAPTGSSLDSISMHFGGVRDGLVDTPRTCDALVGKPISIETFMSVLPTFQEEVKVSAAPSGYDPEHYVAAPAYRQAVAESLFFKFFLGLMPAQDRPSTYESACGHYQRAVSQASQHMDHTAPAQEAPLGLSVHKVEGLAQVSGQTRYTADLVVTPDVVPAGEEVLWGAPVLCTKLKQAVTQIDATKALSVPGVVRFISAADLKAIGAANMIGNYQLFIPAKKPCEFVGQYIGLMVGTSLAVARRAAMMVVVTYGPSLTVSAVTCIEDAIEAGRPVKTEFPAVDLSGNDPSTSDAGVSSSKNTISGIMATNGFQLSGERVFVRRRQKHFYMETDTTLAVPTPDHLSVWTSTQDTCGSKRALVSLLNVDESTVVVSNTQTGGGYGGKHWKDYPCAGATAVAARVLKKPVCTQLDRHTDLLSLGGRPPASATFQVAWDDRTGKISTLNMTVTVDGGGPGGRGPGCTCIGAYTMPAKLNSQSTSTDTPPNGIMRAPGDFQGMIFTEAAVEAAITAGSFDEITLKNANLGAEVQRVWTELDTKMGGQAARKAAVEQFNKQNRWRKRGIWSMPVKYGRGNHEREMVILEIADDTGVVTVSASGIEMGQGLNTKVAQAVSLGLGKLSSSISIPLSMIHNTGVKTTSSFPSASGTSGSGTSESCCDAALKACAKVVKLLAPYAKPGLDWVGIVRAAAAGGVRLSAQVEGQHLSGGEYYIYAAGATEVELDVLTGEYEILRTDIVYDSGISLNPGLDIGQVEGCYVMAAGMCLTEFQSHSKIDGRLIGAGTWDYKPPCSLDIPLEFNIWFTQTANTAQGNVLGSKCATEPAMPLGAGAFFALKQAIYAAREDATGKPREYFPMPLPATPAHVQPLCLVDLGKA